MSYLIAIDGTDASGKKTQASLLSQFLKTERFRVREISFPDYDDPSSTLVRMYLNGEFGSRPEDTGAYAASVFFAADRYASFVKKWRRDYLSEDCVIILDRYTSSNAIHQLSKIQEKRDWGDYLSWLYDFEYGKLALPMPDLTLFLEMPPAVSLKLLEKRCAQKGITGDIHERDARYLQKSYEAALFACETWNWTKIPCAAGNTPLAVERIHRDIREKVLENLPRELQRSGK